MACITALFISIYSANGTITGDLTKHESFAGAFIKMHPVSKDVLYCAVDLNIGDDLSTRNCRRAISILNRFAGRFDGSPPPSDLNQDEYMKRVMGAVLTLRLEERRK